MKTRSVSKETRINAPVSKVWEVLIAPKFIRQWDALPEDFQDYYLEVGREIEWAGISRLIVKEMVPNELLIQSLFLNKWDIAPSECDVQISYILGQQGEQSSLKVEIGDFSSLKDGEKVQEQYADFADKALRKIKALSENKV